MNSTSRRTGTKLAVPAWGLEFIGEVRAAIDTIVRDPQRNEILYRDVRKLAVHRFPFVVLYRFDDDEILIISVFHTARNPDDWKSRD